MIAAALQLLAADVGSVLCRGKLRDGNTLGWEVTAGMIAVVALATVTAWLTTTWLKARHKKNRNSPHRLLKELCAAHRLNHRERSLLARLVEHHHLVQPATLFVEPRLWEPGELPTAGMARAAELVALREKLFRRT